MITHSLVRIYLVGAYSCQQWEHVVLSPQVVSWTSWRLDTQLYKPRQDLPIKNAATT